VVKERVQQASFCTEDREHNIGESFDEQRSQSDALRQWKLVRDRRQSFANSGRDVGRQAAPLEQGKKTAKTRGGGVTHNCRRMASLATDRRAHRATLLLGNLDGIEGLAANPRCELTGFRQRVADPLEQFGMLVSEKLRAELASCLLIA